MDKIARLNPNKITDTGYYFDIDNGVMFQLTDEEVVVARNYFHMPSLASKRIIQPKRKNSDNRHYKLAEEQKYNDGKHRKRKHQSSNSLKKFFIGGLLFVVTVYGAFQVMQNSSKALGFDEEDIQETYLSSVQYSMPEEELFKNSVVDENSERMALVEKYCNIYQVDFNIAYNRLVELTNHFTSQEYSNGYIPGVTCKGENVFANSEEELLLYYVRCVKQLPNQLGISTENLLIHNDYKSSDDYASIIGYYNHLLGVDPLLSYAITQAETGWDSDLFLNSNNPAGLRLNGDWWRFSTKEEGLIELALEILKYNRKGAYTIEEIGMIHAPVEDSNENWVPSVTNIYNSISNNSEILEKLQGNNTEFIR